MYLHTFAAHFRQTSRSADLTNNSDVTLLNEVPEDSRVLYWQKARKVKGLLVAKILSSYRECYFASRILATSKLRGNDTICKNNGHVITLCNLIGRS